MIKLEINGNLMRKERNWVDILLSPSGGQRRGGAHGGKDMMMDCTICHVQKKSAGF